MSNISELEEKIRQLEEMLTPSDLAFPIAWKLNRNEARVLACLASSIDGVRTHEVLKHAIWGWETPDSSDQQLKGYIWWIRKRTQPYGIRVLTMKCIGYRLTDESLKIIRSISNERTLSHVDHRRSRSPT